MMQMNKLNILLVVYCIFGVYIGFDNWNIFSVKLVIYLFVEVLQINQN